MIWESVCHITPFIRGFYLPSSLSIHRVQTSVWHVPTSEMVLTACPHVPLEWMMDRGGWSSSTPTGTGTVSHATTTAHRGGWDWTPRVCFIVSGHRCAMKTQALSVRDDDVFMCYRCSGPGLNDCLEAARLAVSRWVFPLLGNTKHNTMCGLCTTHTSVAHLNNIRGNP